MIVRMTSNSQSQFPEGAYCPFGPGSYNADPEKGVVVLYHTHRGLCLFETERNGYDDSDFFMTVWNPEKKAPEGIMFATTRGWSYPCLASHPDATAEVQAQYLVWTEADRRRKKILARWAARCEQIKSAAAARISRRELRRLMAVLFEEQLAAVLHLLKTKKFRSKFREDLAGKIRTWIADPVPKYSAPLSRKQLAALVGR